MNKKAETLFKRLSEELGIEDRKVLRRIVELKPQGMICGMYFYPKNQETNEVNLEMAREFLARQEQGEKELRTANWDMKKTDEQNIGPYIMDGPYSTFGKSVLTSVIEKYDEFAEKHGETIIDFNTFWVLCMELPEYRQLRANYYNSLNSPE